MVTFRKPYIFSMSQVVFFGRHLFMLLYCLWIIPLSGQSDVVGIPAIRNYTPEEYQAHNQNWGIVQDRRGLMYFANTQGILEYDGVRWSQMLLNSGAIVRSLALGADGQIYVGGFADFGYLKPDTNLQLKFESLLPFVEKEDRTFADVWQTLSTKDGVYFVTQKFIFLWDGQRMRKWNAKTSFHVGFEVNGNFFVRQQKVGLMHILGDSLVMAPLGETFADERIMAMLPYAAPDDPRIILATRNHGLLLYDGHSVQPFINQADDFLKEGQVYCATRLPGHRFAFGTLQKGVYVMDDRGRILYHLDKSTGLQDETIWYLYPDRQGSLWIGMHVGISRVESGSAITHWGEKSGIEGSVLDMLRFQGRLYAASSMGIYYLDQPEGTSWAPPTFKRVEGVSPQCWELLPFGNKLMAASFDGVYEIQGTRGRNIDSTYALSLCRSGQDTNRLFVGLQKGIKSLYYVNGNWKDEGLINPVDQEIPRIFEATPGELWIAQRYNGLGHLVFTNGRIQDPVYTRYDTLNGLPDAELVFAFRSARGIRFSTDQGIYRFDPATKSFTHDSLLFPDLSSNVFLFKINEDRDHNLWLIKPDEMALARVNPDNSYSCLSLPFMRYNAISDYIAYPDPAQRHITWIGCIDRILQYDARIAQVLDTASQTFIRSVTAYGDSILYGGAGLNIAAPFVIRHGYKSMRIAFASPSYDLEEKTVYQYKLEGYDAAWSKWSTEAYKDYTGLSGGHYRFLVRARNIYGVVGPPAILDFQILPPFYLSWWAYIIYALMLLGIGYALWRVNLRRIQSKHATELRQVEFEKLKELDQLKSSFFANISHEFRTPLTLILGPVENLMERGPAPDDARQYSLIKRNAQRLLQLINQLLELSKLESGKLKLNRQPGNITSLIKGVVQSFESLAMSKGIQLHYESNADGAVLSFDRDKLEQVLINLMANALKFTPHGGSVSVKVQTKKDEGTLSIAIVDTGQGIAADELPHIFNRFYQGSNASHAAEPGTGIGLALSKELVELHQGKIEVQSTLNQGTCFTIVLPYDGALVANALPESQHHSRIDINPDIQANLQAPISEHLDESDPGKTLLLVEDNPDMQDFVSGILASEYKIWRAMDGQEGVEMAIEHIPDIIVSDVMMPRLDGLQLVEILKKDERTSHIPIILLTSKADIESRLAGLDRGADEYLAKPFNRHELLVRARNLQILRSQLIQRYGSMTLPAPVANKDLEIEDAFLLKIRGMVEEHLAEEDFDIDGLARMAGMSRSQLFRKIKALTGQSPSMFIRTIRLQHARKMLEATDMNVSEVAYATGFSSPSYFSDAFAETFGIRPSQVKSES